MADRITVTTALGDTLRFMALTGSDHVSQPFVFEVRLASEDMDIAAEDLLGTSLTVTTETEGGPRHITGLIAGLRLDGFDGGLATYVADVRPWVWFLSKRWDCRIFQAMSVVDIVEAVLGEGPGADFELRLQGSYDPLEYTVQYDETDLAFVMRLMERAGIFWFFEYEDGGHKMILTDANAELASVDGLETLKWYRDTARTASEKDHLWEWIPATAVVEGAYAHDAYDFTKPSADLAARSDGPMGHEADGFEAYRHPGTHLTVADGDAVAALRREELQAGYARPHASGSARGLHAGAIFSLEDFPRDVENAEYLVLSCAYDITDSQYVAGDRSRGMADYQQHLTLHPTVRPYRAPRVTPVPVMRGPQTAIVTGPAGEEIYPDEFARVKVQFHWDRLGGADENTTCFVRVSAAWAGAGYGFIQIPRIGQEVIVDFLEGDPDRPIITGRVYNAEQMPPYGLPGNATQSGWKSNSSPGGGGFNEIRFEDKAGSEEVYFQAQKDHTELIKNDEARTIGHDFSEDVGNNATQSVGVDRTESVGNDKAVTVGNNQNTSIGADDTESVGANRSLTVGADETISVGSSSTETIGLNHTQTVTALQTISVGAARVDTVGGAETRTVGLAQAQTVGAARAVTVGAAQSHDIGAVDSWSIGAAQSVDIGAAQSVSIGAGRTLKIGADDGVSIGGGLSAQVGKSEARSIGEDFAVTAGKTIVLEATDQLTLKCGAATIILKSDGTISFDGKDVKTQASGEVNVKASGDIVMKGSTIKQN